MIKEYNGEFGLLRVDFAQKAVLEDKLDRFKIRDAAIAKSKSDDDIWWQDFPLYGQIMSDLLGEDAAEIAPPRHCIDDKYQKYETYVESGYSILLADGSAYFYLTSESSRFEAAEAEHVEDCIFTNQKFEYTGETKEYYGKTVRRIRAIRDIPRYDIKAGQLGGWLEREHNLDTNDDSWVGGESVVLDSSKVYGDSLVDGNSTIAEQSWVSERSTVINCNIFGSKIAHTTVKHRLFEHKDINENRVRSSNWWRLGGDKSYQPL